MRLVTKESKALSRPEKTVRKSDQQIYVGLVIGSAEGFRWAHANTYMPDRPVMLEAIAGRRAELQSQATEPSIQPVEPETAE